MGNNDTARDPKLGRPGSPDVKCGRWSSPAPPCWWITGTLTSAREAMLSQSNLMTQNQKGLVHQHRGGLLGAGQVQDPGGKLHCYLPQDLKYIDYINTWSSFLQLSNMCICHRLVQ